MSVDLFCLTHYNPCVKPIITQAGHPRITIRRLRLVSIIVPLCFLVVVFFLHSVVFGADRIFEGDIFALTAIGLGVAAFSSWVFAIVDQQEAEVRRRADQLAA